MAGLDHPVSPLTVAKPAYEACQNKQRKPSYWATDRRYFPDGSYEFVSVRIPDNSSKTCRYDMSQIDSRCEGCPQVGVGNAYNEHIRKIGT
jgi:ribosomal protein S27E